jgi:copper homeostasis protein
MSDRVTVEICAGDLESALEAGRGGADRVELCDNLQVGGTTPSAGTIAEACRRLTIPVHVLIRPRAGDFLPTVAEFAAMRHDVETARTHGAAAIVIGILRPDATIDRERTATLVHLARPMSVTFHKAFDEVRDSDEALEVLVALGVDRVLTSGCCPTAIEGIGVLKSLVERTRGRITILAGGRITMEDVSLILQRTGVREIHVGSAVTRTMSGARIGVDTARVQALVALVSNWGAIRP